jgi:hypothetical protein
MAKVLHFGLTLGKHVSDTRGTLPGFTAVAQCFGALVLKA